MQRLASGDEPLQKTNAVQGRQASAKTNGWRAGLFLCCSDLLGAEKGETHNMVRVLQGGIASFALVGPLEHCRRTWADHQTCPVEMGDTSRCQRAMFEQAQDAGRFSLETSSQAQTGMADVLAGWQPVSPH